MKIHDFDDNSFGVLVESLLVWPTARRRRRRGRRQLSSSSLLVKTSCFIQWLD